MHDTFDLDSFSALIREKIISGENPTAIRKYIRHERGLGKTQGNDYYNKIDKSLTKKERAAIPRIEVEVKDVTPEGFTDLGNTAVANAWNISSLEDLVEYSKINLSIWEPVKQRVTIWDGKTGFNAEFKRKVDEIECTAILQGFIESAKDHSPVKFAKTPKVKGNNKLLTLHAPDLHIMKRATREETGHDSYNTKIAIRMFNEAIENLVRKAQDYTEFDKILLIFGNDVMNADGVNGQTFGATPQDNDMGWFQAYKATAKMITETVEKLAAIAPIDVLVCYGNHDTQSVFTLGEYLQAWFRNHDEVVIINGSKSRQYYRHFNNLFCVTHGSDGKLADLPLTMATECSWWSECTSREIWTAHRHAISASENKGVITRILPSLSGTDRWHSGHTFVGNHRVAQALIYDSEGLDAMFQYKPDPSE